MKGRPMHTFTDLDHYLSLSPDQLADSCFHCPHCGRDHQIPFKIVQSGAGTLSSVPDVVAAILGKKARKLGLIYDRQIEHKLAPLVFAPLAEAGLPLTLIPLGDARGELLAADVRVGDQAAADLPDDMDIFLGVGSGVISDLTKWIATQKEKPFILLGTAASMNAYTSITASMTEDKIKTSRWLNPADAVLLDADLLASAPTEMTCSGIGDLLARNVCNADWKLSQILRGTYFCPAPFQMMTAHQDAFLPLAADLGRNDPRALAVLADAVLVSGYSMTVLDGETSPSSGSEHILSHFFDFQHDVFGLPKNFHGTQVGVGTIIMLAAYELLREMDPADLDLADIERRRLSQAAVNLGHRREFGEHDQVFNQVAAQKRLSDVDYRPYLKNIIQNWDQIWTELDPYLVPLETVRNAMRQAGAVTTLAGIQRTKDQALQALLFGARYRPRYTILDLLWELGLFPALAPDILARSGVLAA